MPSRTSTAPIAPPVDGRYRAGWTDQTQSFAPGASCRYPAALGAGVGIQNDADRGATDRWKRLRRHHCADHQPGIHHMTARGPGSRSRVGFPTRAADATRRSPSAATFNTGPVPAALEEDDDCVAGAAMRVSTTAPAIRSVPNTPTTPLGQLGGVFLNAGPSA